ncbi:MAG: hypothetical protein BYD32DRAFT_403029 [Podila humilis]|nr:MAG: hypothetical protein BYD32DRAFT_403029 [Podila humilis]
MTIISSQGPSRVGFFLSFLFLFPSFFYIVGLATGARFGSVGMAWAMIFFSAREILYFSFCPTT